MTEKTESSLSDLRKRIDGIDDQLIRLLKERMDCTDEIGNRKAQDGIPVRNAAREEEILQKVDEIVPEDMREDIRQLYRALFACSRARQIRNPVRKRNAADGCPAVLVLNGPNLNLLGIREPDLYGRLDYAALEDYLEQCGLEEELSVTCVQSNSEAYLVEQIQNARGAYDGIVINPAAYTHTSVALLDALKAVSLPCVEVHLTDVSAREDFRTVSYIREACLDCFAGFGFESYRKALSLLKQVLAEQKKEVIKPSIKQKGGQL